MSIRNPEKAVPALLKRLKNTIQTLNIDRDGPLATKIHEIEDDLNHMKHLFPAVKEWEETILDQFTGLDDYLLTFDGQGQNIDSMLDHVHVEISKIKSAVSPLQQLCPTDKSPENQKPAKPIVWNRSDKGPRAPKLRRAVAELEEKILLDEAMKNLQQVSYDYLDRPQLRVCSLFLSIFPENAIIKKRPLIYWWIGEGLVKSEEEGEQNFEELLRFELIKPYRDGTNNPVVNKCQIHPWIRYMLISLANEAQLFDFDSKGVPLFDINCSRRACLVVDRGNTSRENGSSPNYKNCRTIFNVNENYLDFESEWLANLKKLVVFQLGCWQDSPKESPTHHIEVQRGAFLESLRTQKHMKYVSLRGISRITELPSSIVELSSLEILYLKACYNLETLPPDISSLKKLTHLDVSECYLLESMPKGLENLTSLQVLKGFLIGNSKKTPCRIGDLVSLKNLKRLSIHIGSEAVIEDGDFDNLKDLESVQCLKISWGVLSETLKGKVEKQSFSFPTKLEKLNLEGIPHARVPDWLRPSKLRALKKLYIQGGKLDNLDHGETGRWKVEILRLKYLKKLDIALPKLKEMFPFLRYVQTKDLGETKEIQPSDIAEGVSKDIEWSKEAS